MTITARERILAHFQGNPEPLGPRRLVPIGGRSRATISSLLAKMVKCGELERIGSGIYTQYRPRDPHAPPPEPPQRIAGSDGLVPVGRMLAMMALAEQPDRTVPGPCYLGRILQPHTTRARQSEIGQAALADLVACGAADRIGGTQAARLSRKAARYV